MSHQPVDRSKDYDPLKDYPQNGAGPLPEDAGNALARSTAPVQPPQAAPVPPQATLSVSAQPSSPHRRARSASVAAATAAAPGVPSAAPTPHPPITTASGSDRGAQGAPVMHAPSRTPLSVVTGALNDQPSHNAIPPPHARASSLVPAHSRTASAASSSGRPASHAHTPVSTVMRPPTVRPLSRQIQSQAPRTAATAAANAGGPNVGPNVMSPRPLSMARSRPPSSHFPAQQQLKPLSEVTQGASASPISSSAWGELSLHAANWRDFVKKSDLVGTQRVLALGLCSAMEEATTAHEVATTQLELQQLLQGDVDMAPGHSDAPPPSLERPPPPPRQYRPQSRGGFPEVQQPRPVQQLPGVEELWTGSPSPTLHATQGQPFAGRTAHLSAAPPPSFFAQYGGGNLPPLGRPPAQHMAAHIGQFGGHRQFAAAAPQAYNGAPAHYGPSAASGPVFNMPHNVYDVSHGQYAHVHPADDRMHYAPASSSLTGYRDGGLNEDDHDMAASLHDLTTGGHGGELAPARDWQQGVQAQSSSAHAQSSVGTQGMTVLPQSSTAQAQPAAAAQAAPLALPGHSVSQTPPSSPQPAHAPAPVPVPVALPAQPAPSTRPSSPQVGVRRVTAPTKNGGKKQRGNAAKLRNNNPEEDAERGVPPLPFPRNPRARYAARRRRPGNLADAVNDFMREIRALIFEKAKELGEEPLAFLQEVTMGTGLGKYNYWNVFQQFYSMPPGDWDVRDKYDFSNLSSHDAWLEFQKEADHEMVLDRFQWAFPENVAIKTSGKMDKFFDAVRDHLMDIRLCLAAVHGIQMSSLLAGQNSDTDTGMVAIDMAPNAAGFFTMLGLPEPLAGRSYQNLVQHTADMNEIAARLGIPVPRSSIDLQRIPKLTNPALHKGWDLGRIWNANSTPWFEAANPQLVPVEKRVSECQFFAHLLVCMKNELCIENWPWWIPLPYSPGRGLSADRGLQGYGLREAQYIIQWLDMRDPDDPTRPHILGLRLTFAGVRTEPDTPLPSIRTTPINCPGSPWHGRVLVYYVATHETVSPTPSELRSMRKKSDEIEVVYGFQHHGKEVKDKAEDEVAAAAAHAHSKKRRGQISNETVDSDADASGDDGDAASAMDVDVPPAAAAGRKTRAQVAATLPPIPLEDVPEGESALLPAEMWDKHSPVGGPPNAYWLPPSGKVIEGFPGGVPDNFSVWTCRYACKVAKGRRWSGYKSALTKARQHTAERIKAGLPAPPMVPINKGASDGASERESTNEPEDAPGSMAPRPPQPEPIAPRGSHNTRAATAAADATPQPPSVAPRTSPRKQPNAKDAQRDAERVPEPAAKSTPRSGAKRRHGDIEDDDDDFAALTNKRTRVEKPKGDGARATTATPSRRKSAAAAAAPGPSAPSRASAAAAAPAPSTPSRASAAAAQSTPGPSRTPMRQVTVQMPSSRAPTPAPPAAEKQFRTAMIDAPEGPVPDWLHLVPASLEPAGVQTAAYRIGLALRLRRALPEDYCTGIEDLIKLWPVNVPVPDDLRYIMQAVHNRPGAKEVTAPRPAWLKSVPPGFDPRAVQTAVHRLSLAHKLGLPFLEDDTVLIKRFVEKLPVQFVLPDDFIAVYDAVAPADP